MSVTTEITVLPSLDFPCSTAFYFRNTFKKKNHIITTLVLWPLNYRKTNYFIKIPHSKLVARFLKIFSLGIYLHKYMCQHLNIYFFQRNRNFLVIWSFLVIKWLHLTDKGFVFGTFPSPSLWKIIWWDIWQNENLHQKEMEQSEEVLSMSLAFRQ